MENLLNVLLDKKSILLFLKIVAILIVAGVAFLQIGLDFRFQNERTGRQKLVRSLLILLLGVGFLAALILVVWSDRQSENQVQTLATVKNSAEKALENSKKKELILTTDLEKTKVDLNALRAKYNNAEKALENSEKREFKAIENLERIKIAFNALQIKYNRQVLDETIREKAATHQREQLKNKIGGLQDKLEPFVKVATTRFPHLSDEKNALSKLADELKNFNEPNKND